MSSFSKLLLVCIHLFSSINLLIYKGFYFVITHALHLGFERRADPLGMKLMKDVEHSNYMHVV